MSLKNTINKIVKNLGSNLEVVRYTTTKNKYGDLTKTEVDRTIYKVVSSSRGVKEIEYQQNARLRSGTIQVVTTFECPVPEPADGFKYEYIFDGKTYTYVDHRKIGDIQNNGHIVKRITLEEGGIDG